MHLAYLYTYIYKKKKQTEINVIIATVINFDKEKRNRQFNNPQIEVKQFTE